MSKELTIGGVRISYYDSGTGDAVVLLHSFNHSKLMWLPQLYHLLNLGYRVVAIDFRGHGESGFDEGRHDVYVMAEDVIGVLRHLGIRDAVFVGISMGGYVAFRVWEAARELVRALVLSNTKAEADDEAVKERRRSQIKLIMERGLREFVETYAPRRLSKTTLETKPWVLDFIKSMSLSMRPEAVIATLRAMMEKPDDRDLLRTIDVPTLIIAGKDDAFIPKSSAILMHEGIKGSKLVVLEGAGHVSSLEKPIEFNEHLTALLNSLKRSL